MTAPRKLSPAQLAAGLAATYALRDRGNPERDIKPTSFTASPSLHVEAIGLAILAASHPQSKKHRS